MKEKVLTATWSRGPYQIKASWQGGIYVGIEYPEIGKVTDCMNLQDMKGNAPPFTQEVLETEFLEWCEDQFGEGNPDGAHNLNCQIVNASY